MSSLIEDLPASLTKLVASSIPEDEQVIIRMKGAFKEILVCTARRLLIAKTGFMTGHMFGSNLFQLPMSAVTSVEVKFHLLTGYMEVSTGGMQNTDKTYWATGKTNNSTQAPNCISINSRADVDKYQRACSKILSLAEDARRS